MAKPRNCEHCGVLFTPKGTGTPARFCSRAHKTAAANLEATRGKQLYRLAYNWRAFRSKDPERSNKALGDLTWLLAQYIDQDKEAGVPPPPAGPTDMSVDQSFHTRGRKPARDKGARERQLLAKVLPLDNGVDSPQLETT